MKSNGSPVYMALKQITERGHNPGGNYEGKTSYNLGYESGSHFVMAVSNRDLFDEGWMPKTIMVAREQEMQNNPLEGQTKINLE